MSKRKSLLSVIICICILLTACSEAATEADDNAAAGVSGAAVSDTTDTTVRPEKLPDKWMARGYLMDVAFMIKERTAEGYRATVEIDNFWEESIEAPNWEICLELEDEIIELSGAKIVSQEGMLYTIRGTGENRDYLFGDDGIQFDIAVGCPEGAHEPGLCYLATEVVDVPEKNYKFEVLELEEEGTEVHGTLRLTNCSKKSLEQWDVRIGANFQMKLTDGARIYREGVHRVERKDELHDPDIFDGEYYWDAFYDDFRGGEKIWVYDICGEGKKCSLQKGESVEIPFTGKRVGRKPKVSGAKGMWAGKDTDINWGVIERNYGVKYGKIEKYLVADDVNGVDLFFVFDEKGKDSYTATAELTNVLDESHILPEEKADPEEMLEISDWEICLECEDTIEEIEGAEIVAHEGNVYHIRAADKNKWIPRYGMETFQVKVSCQGEIHHLGKVYLSKVKYRGNRIVFRGRQKELNMTEKDSSGLFGARWRTYQDLYGDWKGAYYDEEYDPKEFDTKEEEDAFYQRRKWGKKMGR